MPALSYLWRMGNEQHIWPQGLPKFDIDQVNQLIRHRRSIKPKDFSGEEINREEIEVLLENAHWAPSHGQNEPWFFVVFAGEGRQKLGEAHAAIYKEHTPAESFKQAKFEKLAKMPLLSSHVIAICRRRKEPNKIPVIEDVEAVASAVQNLHLSATAMGLAGFWASGGATYLPAMCEFLGLGEDDAVLGLFYLGRTQKEWPQGTRRAPWGDKVRWVE